jgi:hypothetical protein
MRQQPKAENGIESAIGVGESTQVCHLEAAEPRRNPSLQPGAARRIASSHSDFVSGLHKSRGYLSVPATNVQDRSTHRQCSQQTQRDTLLGLKEPAADSSGEAARVVLRGGADIRVFHQGFIRLI